MQVGHNLGEVGVIEAQIGNKPDVVMLAVMPAVTVLQVFSLGRGLYLVSNNNNSSGYALAMWPSTSHLA
jgi:hypothetical protein